jgi:chromosomal replication initiation ATPase DnaA
MALSADNLMEAIQQAGDLYHRLVLLAGPQGSGKTAVLQAIGKKTNIP